MALSKVNNCYLWCMPILIFFMVWTMLNMNFLMQSHLNCYKKLVTLSKPEEVRDVANFKTSFYVQTPVCKIPNIDPFNPQAMNIYKRRKFIRCSNESDLVSVLYDDYLQHYVLHINEPVIHKLLNSKVHQYECYYKKITCGSNPETYDKLEPPIYFSQDYVVPLHVEGLIATCHITGNSSHLLQRDAFTFIQYRPPKDLKGIPSQQLAQPRKPSVIMYGIDTLSRINLRRTMPMVYEFLKSPGWYEMQGYTKIGDNSFPNIFAILTGISPTKAKDYICDTNVRGCLDKIPLIWKNFKNAGYLTAYAEDESRANTFTYRKPGFIMKPTDYYFRPFLRALEENTDTYHCPGCRMRYCMGRRVANSYIFDYCRQFMQRYVKERPIWGLFWTNHYSHDDQFMPSAMQHKVLRDLLNYEADGSFEHTIMIFFADHGTRYGDLVHLDEGFLEERLPMMFIYLPPWFRESYPELTNALDLNQHRLSSNFDLYNTLRHIIELGDDMQVPRMLSKSVNCPHCQSLFYPISENRTCAEAGIGEHYCTCHPFQSIQEDPSNPIALMIIDRINQYLTDKNLTEKCSKLTLLSIIKTELRMDIAATLDEDVNVYRTKFAVSPNAAQFDATAIINNRTRVADIDVETISRINEYELDAYCVDDKIQKLYCICNRGT